MTEEMSYQKNVGHIVILSLVLSSNWLFRPDSHNRLPRHMDMEPPNLRPAVCAVSSWLVQGGQGGGGGEEEGGGAGAWHRTRRTTAAMMEGLWPGGWGN